LIISAEGTICPKDRVGAFLFASFSEKEGGLRGGVVSRRFINMYKYAYL
jgi:hypothetical protein